MQNLKVLKSRKQYNLFLENYPAFKGLNHKMNKNKPKNYKCDVIWENLSYEGANSVSQIRLFYISIFIDCFKIVLKARKMFYADAHM